MTTRQVQLADYTTMRVGGPATLLETASEEELIAAVRECDAHRVPVLLVGGGSNLVIADSGFEGRAVLIGHTGIGVDRDGDSVVLRVAAGERWDALVGRAVAEGWSGIEALSGIPGLVGATPIQNVGAYGAETADVLVALDAWDRQRGERVRLSADMCGFTYRGSIFKHSDRYVVLSVEFSLPIRPESAPVRYAELARSLGIEVGQVAPLADVRASVLALRGSKGMVLDPTDHDTWSAGSFFTNPIVAPHDVPDGAPTYPASDGLVKTSAAWLIEHAGFAKGYGNKRASLSTKHTLALTNRGAARTDDILALARNIRRVVGETYGIELRPEPLLIGCAL